MQRRTRNPATAIDSDRRASAATGSCGARPHTRSSSATRLPTNSAIPNDVHRLQRWIGPGVIGDKGQRRPRGEKRHDSTLTEDKRGAFAARAASGVPRMPVDAHPHPRHLRHLHGWAGRDGARGRPPGHRLRRQRLPADERPAARAGHRAGRRLRRRPAGHQARSVRGRQRRHARQPVDRSGARRRRAATPAARSGWPSTCCTAATCWPWPAPTARPRPRRCWPGSSSTRVCKPGFLVGGVPQNFGISARGWARADCFVIEADEYDTAFFDKRSKFVHYRPRTAILNNLEFDHADIFPDLAAIETQFHHLVRTVPAKRPTGRQCARRGAGAGARARLLERGAALRRAQGRARRPARARRTATRFDVLRGSLKIARVEWSLLGEHNQLNALAAIAAAEHVGVAPGSDRGRTGPLRERAAPPGAARRSRAASRCTTTSRTTPPRCTPRSPACAARSTRGHVAGNPAAAHPGGVRAALQHDEARHDEVAAALGTGRGRPGVLPAGRLRLGRRRGAGADGRAGGGGRQRAQAGRSHRARGAPRATTCWCMSNGGFGGIHGKLLDALQARRLADARAHSSANPPAVPARLSLVAAVVQGAHAGTLGCSSTRRRSPGGARSCRPRHAKPGDLVRDGTRGLARALDGGARQLARRLLRHGGGRSARLRRGGAEPGRRPGARPGAPRRRADRLPRPGAAFRVQGRVRRRVARVEAAAHRRPVALRGRDRQGRRVARLARDERALCRLAPCGCSTAATTRCRTSICTCRSCSTSCGCVRTPFDRRGTPAARAGDVTITQ